MSQPIPLGTALCIELDHIIVCNNVIIAMTATLLSKVHNRLFEELTACNGVLKVIET